MASILKKHIIANHLNRLNQLPHMPDRPLRPLFKIHCILFLLSQIFILKADSQFSLQTLQYWTMGSHTDFFPPPPPPPLVPTDIFNISRIAHEYLTCKIVEWVENVHAIACYVLKNYNVRCWLRASFHHRPSVA